jgi:hypothetical protein
MYHNPSHSYDYPAYGLSITYYLKRKDKIINKQQFVVNKTEIMCHVLKMLVNVLVA